MGFLGLGNSKWNRIGQRGKSTMIGLKQHARVGAMQSGKVLTTVGKGGQIAGKAGMALTPAVTALNPAAGLVLGTKSAKVYAAGSVAKVAGRGLKHASKGKLGKFDPGQALMRD